jgi:hypothetical protein
MAKRAAQWQLEGLTFAWFRNDPDWGKGSLCWFWNDDPQEPCHRAYRFSLIGGGQATLTEEWRIVGLVDDKGVYTGNDTISKTWIGRRREGNLLVTPHVGDHVARYRGTIERDSSSDITADAVVFPRNTPQEIANRAAATISATACDEDAFYALLDASEGCHFCGRPLRDEVSKLVGVGPDCARKHRVPHSIEAANRRLELRRKILGEFAETRA